MCWNEEVSWATFIIGTIANIFLISKSKNKNIYAIALVWQWVLLMQIFEALIWRSKNCGTMNKIGNMGAFIANVTQPLVVFLSILVFTKQSKKFKLFGGIITILYSTHILVKYLKMPSIGCIEPNKECKHVEYKWWNYMSPLYYAITLALVLLLAKPSKIYIPQLVYISIMIVIARSTSKDCGVGSLWCWLAAFAPIFTYVYYKHFMKKLLK